MSDHVTSIEDRIVTAVDNNGATYETAESKWRWTCSCGRGGDWKRRRHAAKIGALRHGTTRSG